MPLMTTMNGSRGLHKSGRTDGWATFRGMDEAVEVTVTVALTLPPPPMLSVIDDDVLCVLVVLSFP